MSNQLKYALSFSFLFVLGFGSSWMIYSYESELDHETGIIENARMNSTALYEKHLMPITLTLKGPDQYPANYDDRVDLLATIQTPYSSFCEIQYNWSLPDGVNLISGDLQGAIQNPQAGQIYSLPITVQGFSSLERMEISIVAKTTGPNGNTLGNSSVITSRPEDSMETIAPEIMAKAQDFKARQDRERMPASSHER